VRGTVKIGLWHYTKRRQKRGKCRQVVKCGIRSQSAASLGGEWQAVTEENKAGFRFFKVEVVLP
jgi:hypothetical protein